ncbi:MAG: LysM peptidoglycan-binding domain-containing protein, partial [Ilumatobacteraceae bacterium]
MTRRNERSAGRFALSSVAFLAIAIGVPYLLVRVSTARFGSASPLGRVKSWDSSAIGDALRNPLSDDPVVDLLLRASLCIVWIAVAVIVVDTIVEVVHQVRHHGVPMPAMRGLGWSQGIARFIAVGLLVVMPMTSVKPSLAHAPVRGQSPTPTRAPLVIDYGGAFDQTSQRANGIAQDVAPATVPAAPTVATYTVQRGDSVFAIAANLAHHDEQRTLDIADEILDLNLDATMSDGQRFSNPAYVEPGWVLRLPATSADLAPPAVATPPDLGDRDEVHVVVPGDTLWDIAEDEYGSGSEWTEIWAENAGDDMGAGRSFDDPDLILPGWELDLPDDDSAVVPPLPENTAPVDAPIPRSPAPSPSESSAESSSTTVDSAPAQPGAVDPTAVDATWAAPVTVGPPTATTTTAPNVTDVTPGDELPGHTSATDAPSPIRLEHAAMLAAGILVLVGVRRRQRLRAATPRSRIPEPRPEVVETELLLRRIEPGERGPRVDVACRSAAFYLIGTGVQIVVVQVSPDGEIALTLSGDHVAPVPWTGTGDNMWRLPAGIPVELLSESARRVGMPCVAFAQLGVDGDGWEVLVDLEACGTLAIDAQPSQADAVVRGLAAGLAASLYAEVAHLVTVSLPPDVLLDHRNAHQAESIDAAFDHAASLVGSTSMDERSSFELRSLRTGGEMWEPAVILLTDRDAV